MRRGVLWYEMRELGVIALLTPLFVVAGIALIAGMMTLGGAQSEQIANVLTRSMEILYPLAAGMVAATIVAADPGVEWQLTMPTPYRVTFFRRLMIVLLWSALVAFGDALVLRIIGRWVVPKPFLISQLMWLSPMLSFAALGALLALLVRNRSASAGLVGGIWIVEALFHGYLLDRVWARPWFSFATTWAAGANFWLANRLTLIGLAAVLFLGAAALLQQSEMLLAGGEA
jgi:hypothetical protein